MSPTSNKLSKIFLQIEADLGATDLAGFVMETLHEALGALKVKDVDDMFRQFKILVTEIKNTQPRISLVIYYFYEIWEELQVQKEKGTIHNIEDFNEIVKSTIIRLRAENDEDFESIISNGAELIKDGDSILVHSHSGTIRRIIAKAQYLGRKFHVILAEQEAEKTLDMIEYFSEKGVPFTVVPEYMLSHILQDVSKVFFGATTMNFEQNFICDAGSYSVLAEFHEVEIPTYMFLSTKKFSLWQSEMQHHTYKTKQKKILTKSAKVVNYERIKFSHDRVPAKLFNYVVTESGAYNPKEIQEIYTARYIEREHIRTKYFD